MQRKIKRIVPVIIACIVIILIIYLFANVKQPYITCSRTNIDNLGIKINENISVKIDSKKINKINLEKSIRFPEKYFNDDTNINLIKNKVKKSYSYLDKNVKYMDLNNGFLIKVNISNEGTILLNNIKFYDDDCLDININSNTRSSSVVTVSIDDNYTEGEFITNLVKNGFSCK